VPVLVAPVCAAGPSGALCSDVADAERDLSAAGRYRLTTARDLTSAIASP
jgi:hypothetical protein